jgi:hypothetical protein
MKRYHEEKKLMESRAKAYRQINSGWLSYSVPNTGPSDREEIEVGRYRKALRCGGCGRARCQVCHSDKFPKRKLTHKEIKSLQSFREQQREL